MPSHFLRTLLCGVLLIPLAWIGIALVDKLHGRGVLVPALVAWGVVTLADLSFTLYSVLRSRRHRLNRTPEPK